MRKIAQLVLLMVLCGVAHAEVAVPPWTKFAIDNSGILTPEQLQALNQRLADLEASKGAQFGILILPTTQPEDIFQFGMRVFDTWKLGRKGVDDGLLWVITSNNGRHYIFTGYGMEGALPDVKIKHIINETIDPTFKRNGLYAGLDAGVTALTKIIESEPFPPPSGHSSIWYASVPHASVAIPPWTQPVIDMTGTLDPMKLQALNQRLKAYEYSKGAQIGVLIVPTTQPEDIVHFSRRLCETWQLGRDGIDDGVIIAVSTGDKQLQIAPGMGLDKALNKTKLSEILNETMVPNLMLGEYDNGIGAGVDAIIKVVDTVPLPPPHHSLIDSISKNLPLNFEQYWGAFILAVLFGIVMLYRYTRRKKDEGA